MTGFKQINKKKLIWKSGFMCIYVYGISLDINPESTVDLFLKPENFSIEDESALGRPFNIDEVTSKDFKNYSQKELFEYFDRFSGESGWSRPADIKEEMGYFKDLIVNSGTDSFYFISNWNR